MTENLQPTVTPVVGDTRRVAIVGAGVAGLQCARRLQAARVPVEVFDKGRRLGGRLATRRQEGFQFDHGVQYVRGRGNLFREQMEQWRASRVIDRWEPRIKREGELRTESREAAPMYVGVGSMRSICEAMGLGLTVHLSTEVCELKCETGPRPRWYLVLHDGVRHGPFETLILTAPVPQARVLLGPQWSALQVLDRVRYAPCLAALVGFAEPVAQPFDLLRGKGSLALASRNRSKPEREPGCSWVLHGSERWSKQYLEAEPEKFAAELISDLSRLVGGELPQVRVLRGHRWRYARTTQALGQPFVFEPKLALGYAGDGCLGGRVEAAFESGDALGLAVAMHLGCA